MARRRGRPAQPDRQEDADSVLEDFLQRRADARGDCPNESDHVWECCDTHDLCVWCRARVMCRHT